MKKTALLQVITFLAAFLLFQIELIVGKMLLPDYGGSYMVWGSCMVFFQATLFAGYYFSHLFLRKLGLSKYLVLHIVLMLLPLLFFPGRDLVIGNKQGGSFLALDVFLQLFLTIGPVFFLLTTMSMVTQVWWAGSDAEDRQHPYSLYAWSNFGSFAALLSYPFVFEYFFDLSSQLLMWRIGYFVLIGLNIAGWFLIRKPTVANTDAGDIKAMPKDDLMRVFLLSAGAVMIFLAVTNIITIEIAPLPLIWIMPLWIYLLAFVLNFKQKPWYPGVIEKYIHSFIGLSIVLFFILEQQKLPVLLGVPAILILLFVVSMYCQRQVLALRPSDTRQITAFYLTISFGGFAGGLFTTWVVPVVWNLLLEYPLALLVIAATFAPLPAKNSKNTGLVKPLLAVVGFVAALLIWPRIFTGDNFITALILICGTFFLFRTFKDVKYATAGSIVLVILCSAFLDASWTGRQFVYKIRNFYGIYQVYNTGRIRRFRHGETIHGTQIQDPEAPAFQLVPTTYYGGNSPVAPVLGSPQSFPAHRVGVIGLGAGTLSLYIRTGDVMDFYELDPEVNKIAQNYFTFLKSARGKVNFFAGDGRINLKNRPEIKYDILIIDAFNGDAVPFHLISREMIKLCRQRLNPGGILMFHLSNRYFKLDNVLSRVADDAGTVACFKSGTKSGDNIEELSLWGAITWDKNVRKKLTSEFGWAEKDPAEFRALPVWTDQYSSVLPIFK